MRVMIAPKAVFNPAAFNAALCNPAGLAAALQPEQRPDKFMGHNPQFSPQSESRGLLRTKPFVAVSSILSVSALQKKGRHRGTADSSSVPRAGKRSDLEICLLYTSRCV